MGAADSGAMPARVPGFAEHQELAMMVQSGLTPMQAIMCATKTNAELLGIEQTTGTLTVGKQADLIVLDGNPLDDIRNTRKIAGVFARGKYYSRASLDKILLTATTSK